MASGGLGVPRRPRSVTAEAHAEGAAATRQGFPPRQAEAAGASEAVATPGARAQGSRLFGSGGKGSSGKGQPRRQQRRQKKKGSDVGSMSDIADGWEDATAAGMSELLKLVAIMTLSLGYQTRVLRACSLMVRLLPTTMENVPSLPPMVKSTTTDLEAHRRSLAKEAAYELGSPHCHAFHTLVEWATELMKTAPSASLLAALTAYVTSIEAETLVLKVVNIAKQVRWLRVGTTHRSVVAKLEVNVVDGTPAAAFWAEVDLALQASHAAEVKSGIAPRSNLERRIQAAIGEE